VATHGRRVRGDYVTYAEQNYFDSAQILLPSSLPDICRRRRALMRTSVNTAPPTESAADARSDTCVDQVRGDT
jgi:hypothetical protein